MTFQTFLLLRLDNMTRKPELHATGVRKPNLTQVELGKKIKLIKK